ncbi:RcnB family protein [Sphingomonas canadensis]|uniref:RcnB family protein n=1 Tax=Sphingomonas canadensis TaxID=1219257 RepID=A0ABW3H2K0_9SPHN|nr:RcnB family protein [Sphingomonas canadensis]MCW3835155.1 RcnB family protein [Sphingomonas canadensis]
MKKLITAALIAAVAIPTVAVPTAASAQSHRELQRDRQDIRQERRDVERARRYGNPRDVRREQRELRDARREYREDLRDRNRNWGHNDWRDYRTHNRGAFSRGHWRAPFRYQAFRPGLRIGASFYAPGYRIADPWRYRLPRPGYNQVWVRHYDDLILVDTRRGIVIRVINNFYW